jgi:hypothetical protein
VGVVLYSVKCGLRDTQIMDFKEGMWEVTASLLKSEYGETNNAIMLEKRTF